LSDGNQRGAAGRGAAKEWAMTDMKSTEPRDILRKLTPEAFASLGAEQIAYLRPVVVNGQHVIAIHAANGQPIGGAPNAELAAAAIIQHGMAPSWVN
jgi:hypothetical protein